MNRYHYRCVYVYVALLVSLLPSQTYAFEYVDKKESFENLKYLSFRLGAGVHSFVDNDNVDGVPGPAFQFAISHQLVKGIDLEFLYQFSTFRFMSPDPIVTDQTIDSRTGMHQEMIRAIFYLPTTMGQPFVSAGVGGYHFTKLDRKTALDLPFAFEVPVGAGFRAYLLKNQISLQFEYTYHFLFGENQSDSTLGLMNKDEFRFNAYTLMGSFSFHFF